MDERIQALLDGLNDPDEAARTAALAELSDEQIGGTEADLLDHFRSVRAGDVDGADPDDLSVLSPIRDAVAALRAEAEKRYQAAEADAAQAAERAAEAAAVEAELLTETAEDGDEAEGPDDEAEGSDDAETDDDAEATAEVVAEAEAITEEAADEPVTASARRPSLAALASSRRPTEAQPRAASPARTRPQIMGLEGRTFDSISEMAGEFIRIREGLMDVAPGFQDRFTVASIKVDLPEERHLRYGDSASANGAKLDALTQDATNPDQWQDETITASGGWCAPLEPIYDYVTVSDAGRPVRAGLPVVQADRGGVRVVRGQGIADITEATAITVWDAATDTTPGESRKNCLTVACDAVTDVELQAVVRCLQFGNFQSRAFPEWVEGKIRDTLAVHARVAEREIQDDIEGAAGTLNVTEAQLWGAARAILHAVRQAGAGLRSRQRMRPDAQLRFLAPAWLLDAMAADIVAQQASGELDALEVTQTRILGMLRAAGVSPTWTWEGPTGSTGVWGAQGDGVGLRNWPGTVEWGLWPEGHFVFLDGGELNLGIVRDSTINDTNDYQLFAETFERTAALGPEALWVTHTICPDGDSQLPTVNTPCVAS